MSSLKKLLFYGGIEREEYLTVRDSVRESNRIRLRDYSALAGCGLLVLFVLSFFFPVLESSRAAYLVCTVICAVLTEIASGPAKTCPVLTRICQHMFTTALLAFGIVLGTAVEPNQASASFAILMFAVPLLFTETPIVIIVQLLCSIIVYMFAARATQSDTMFDFNASVIIPYGIISLILCAMIMRVSFLRWKLEHQSRYLSEHDQLTGLLNRWSFEKRLDELKNNPDPAGATFCAFDIDGLKRTNDSMGHAAGDELISGAAEGLRQVYGEYGTLYRTGGDEFFAILDRPHPDPEKLKEALEQYGRSFRGEFINRIGISIGTEEYRPGDDIEQITRKADEKMYFHKEERKNSSQGVQC